MRHILATTLLLALLGASSHAALAGGPSEALSNASSNLSTASGLVVGGSIQTLAASGQVVVGSMAVAGEAVTLVLQGVGTGVVASVKVSGELATSLGVAVGTVVSVVAERAGYALVTAGKMLAYLPNSDTQSLLHQSRVDGGV